MGQLTDELQEERPQDGTGQVSKWGFVPGDDNTTDLDLERNGQMLLYIYYSPAYLYKKRFTALIYLQM